jgi:hypothetical protein
MGGRLLALLGRLALVLAAIVALAALDVCTLEVYLKPLARDRGVPWAAFEVEVLGVRTLAWHFFFAPAGLVLAGLAGFAARRLAGALAGAILFACGLEDAAYYALLGRLPPRELPWLDLNPAIAWTRLVLGGPHVTRAGLLVAMAAALAAAVALLRGRERAPGADPRGGAK